MGSTLERRHDLQLLELHQYSVSDIIRTIVLYKCRFEWLNFISFLFHSNLFDIIDSSRSKETEAQITIGGQCILGAGRNRVREFHWTVARSIGSISKGKQREKVQQKWKQSHKWYDCYEHRSWGHGRYEWIGRPGTDRWYGNWRITPMSSSSMLSFIPVSSPFNLSIISEIFFKKYYLNENQIKCKQWFQFE